MKDSADRIEQKRWAFEDLQAGRVLDLGTKSVTAEEVIDFASQFDPQPMHLDENAGKASVLGGLSASGWHICAMLMRMMCDAFLLDSTSQGAPGVDHVKWRRPVLAGDVLTGRGTVLSARRSASKPHLGFVTARYELLNQRAECVTELKSTGMFLLRNPDRRT